jgi:hypothetical protein
LVPGRATSTPISVVLNTITDMRSVVGSDMLIV